MPHTDLRVEKKDSVGVHEGPACTASTTTVCIRQDDAVMTLIHFAERLIPHIIIINILMMDHDPGKLRA
jgi:hypothetical protein